MATNPHAQPHPEQIPPKKGGASVWIIVAIILGVLLMIIAVLVMMLLPAVFSVRGAARQLQAQNNARQICLAMHNYAGLRNGGLPSNSKDDTGNELFSWRCGLLNHLQKRNFADAIQSAGPGSPWNDPVSKELVDMAVPEFQSPRGDSSAAENVTHFVAVNDPNAPLYGDKVSLDSIENGDGLGNTALFFEHVNSDIAWAEPRDVTIAEAIKIIQNGDGTVVAMADASVIVVQPSASAEDITKLFLLGDGAAENLPVR